jgi:hypothetical protein
MKPGGGEKARFEGDDKKDVKNRRKHGVSFAQAQEAFLDPHRVIAEDARHSGSENRFYCIGETGNGIVTVRFTYRGQGIRIFGAGHWRAGKELYENQNKKKNQI